MATLTQIMPAQPVMRSVQTETEMAASGPRTSSHVIYVDLPGNPEEMLLVHGYTGAYDLVSRSVATYVRSIDRRGHQKPLYGSWTPDPQIDGTAAVPSDATLQRLRTRGYITELSAGDEEALFTSLVNKIHERKLRTSPGYIVMPTYNCNLRCGYCFQDYMRTDSRYAHLLREMDIPLVDRMFQGMEHIEVLHGCDSGRRRVIGFFGGEPLLAANRRIVDYIIHKALDLGKASFWAVSNATEIDAYADLLGPDAISSIQVTLDGSPEAHDQRRIYADGRGSFERIANNITMALKRGVVISIRVNVDRSNLRQLPILADIFHERGWDRYAKTFSAYTAVLRHENEKQDKTVIMNTWDLEQAQDSIEKEFPQISVFRRPDAGIKDRARQIFHNGQDTRPVLHESFCSAHTGMYIFDPFGDIYACWDRTGDPSVRIGHLKDDGNVALDSAQTEFWRARTVASNPVCRQCRYALHCGGGCAVLAFARSGDYYTNYCDGFASRFRACVAEAYQEHVAGTPMRAAASLICDQ